MKQDKFSNVTLKYIISIIFSVRVATFVMNILESVEVNVWFIRFIGVFVAIIVVLILYYLWIVKDKKH